MAKDHLSLRLDTRLVESIDAMADHRNVNRTAMIERMLVVAEAAKQRTCKVTHRTGERCGECGLLLDGDTRTDYERL